MRKLSVIVVWLLAALLALPTFAQDMTVFCGTLAAADCDLLNASQTAMNNRESGTVEFSGALNIAGIPDTPDLAINLSGSGAFALDKMALDALMAQAEAMDPANMQAAEIVPMVLEVLKAVDATLILNAELPAELAQQGGLPGNTITLDTAFVDGVAYIDFTKLDAIAGGMLAAQNFTGVGGIDIVAVINELLAQNPEAIEQLQGLLSMAAANPEMLAQMSGSTITPEQMAALGQYVTVARVDGGAAEAVFESTLDLAGMFADPVFTDLMRAQMEAQGQTMTDEEFQQVMAIVGMMAADMTATVTQRVDTASTYTTFIGMDFSLDASTLLALSGAGSSGSSVISLNLGFNFGGFNSTTVSAPAGAQLADPAMVVQMLAGGMMGQ